MLKERALLSSGGRPIDTNTQSRLKSEAYKNDFHPIKYDLNRSKSVKGETLLHIHAKNGDSENARILINAGSDVNAQDDSGKTPIILALENKPDGYLGVVGILCRSNANIHISDKYGISAAQLVLGDCSCINNPLSQFFLDIMHHEYMCNSQMTAEKLVSLNCPLWQAVLLSNAEVIEQMLLRGCPVDSCDPENRFTALTRAVQLMDLEIVKVLIKHGANVNFVDSKGFLPIAHYGFYNSKTQQPEIIRILLNETTLLKDQNQENIVMQLKRPFKSGSRKVIQMLFKQHNNILNVRGVEGLTPLHYLCTNTHSDIIEELQGKQININVSDYRGWTPLHAAADASLTHIDTFKFLLENGANVNARAMYPETVPLFCLCQNYAMPKEVYNNVMNLFFQYNVDIQFIGSRGKTVFDIIAKKKSFYMSEPLLAHLALLDELEEPIAEGIRKKINSNAIFKAFFDICKAELAKMKTKSINKKLTLYMILVDQINEEQIMKSCRFDPNSLSKFENLKKQFDSSHPYHCLIQKCVSSIVLKLELLQQAATILCKLLKLNNDHIVVTEIIDYLDNQDLQSLIKI